MQAIQQHTVSSINEIRKNISKGGIFGIFGSSEKQGDESSDEEPAHVLENDEFIRNGQRGIVVLKCAPVGVEDKAKILHIHLYSGQVYQYKNGKRKCHSCAQLSNVSLHHDGVVTVDMQRRGLTVQKRYVFDSEESALLYQKYIEFRNDTGVIVKAAFDAIDRRGAKLITYGQLRAALRSVDLSVSENHIHQM
jgi:hypothetical protein